MNTMFKSFILFIIVVVGLAVLLSANKPKEYTVTLSENQIVLLYNTLGYAKTAMETSREPSVNVHDAKIAIDSLQSIIRNEYIRQSDTTKQKPDTLIKKK